MKRALVFTRAAAQDMDKIWEYIARDNIPAAAQFTDTIEEKCHFLLRYPEVGKACTDLAPDLYSFPCKDYLIFYRPNDCGIQIIRVIHAARNILALFE